MCVCVCRGEGHITLYAKISQLLPFNIMQCEEMRRLSNSWSALTSFIDEAIDVKVKRSCSQPALGCGARLSNERETEGIRQDSCAHEKISILMNPKQFDNIISISVTVVFFMVGGEEVG